MKKKKVAQLFITEILIITLACTIVGGGIGAAVSVPVTNSLLETQIESQQNNMGAAFGRDFNLNSMQPPADDNGDMADDNAGATDNSDKQAAPDESKKKGPMGMYITEVSNAVNLGVLIKLLISCVVLALLAGMVSVFAILRYEPIDILSNRD